MLEPIKKIIKSALGNRAIAVSLHKGTPRESVIKLANSIYKERLSGLTFNEFIQLFMCVKATNNTEGDLAEVGVFKGASAKGICEARENKILHLFDTFEGLPDVEPIDSKLFHKGQYKTDFESTRDYLSQYKDVHFYKGIFPETAAPVKDRKFSFVHLDVDTYKSTLSCVEFFHPRMAKGGIILSHDYSIAEGVRKAFEEFYADKPETVVPLSENQCLVVKF